MPDVKDISVIKEHTRAILNHIPHVRSQMNRQNSIGRPPVVYALVYAWLMCHRGFASNTRRF